MSIKQRRAAVAVSSIAIIVIVVMALGSVWYSPWWSTKTSTPQGAVESASPATSVTAPLAAGSATTVATASTAVTLVRKQELTVAQLESALRRVALDPHDCAAAGLSTAEVSGVVANVETWLTDNPLALEDADADYGTAKGQFDRLQKLVRSGLATGDDLTAFQTAGQTLATARTARNQVLDTVFSAGTADLSVNNTQSLAIIDGNRRFDVDLAACPTEFLVINDRSEADWVALRDALDNQRISAERGETPDQGHQAFLLQQRTVTATANVLVNFNNTSYYNSIELAWVTALGGG